MKDVILDVFRAFYHLNKNFSKAKKKLNKKSSDPDIHDVIIMEVGTFLKLRGKDWFWSQTLNGTDRIQSTYSINQNLELFNSPDCKFTRNYSELGARPFCQHAEICFL